MKRFAEQPFTLQVEIRDDNGDLADPPSVEFRYRMRTWRLLTATPVTRVSEGVYTTEVTTDCAGNLYGTWETQGSPLRMIPHSVPVYPNNGPNGWVA